MQEQGVDVRFLDGEGEGEVCEGGGESVDYLLFEGGGAVVRHVVGVLAGGRCVFGLDLWESVRYFGQKRGKSVWKIENLFSTHRPYTRDRYITVIDGRDPVSSMEIK